MKPIGGIMMIFVLTVLTGYTNVSSLLTMHRRRPAGGRMWLHSRR